MKSKTLQGFVSEVWQEGLRAGVEGCADAILRAVDKMGELDLTCYTADEIVSTIRGCVEVAKLEAMMK